MKIVVLDGYAENPGDLSWEAFEQLGELAVFDRTDADQAASRIGGAEIVLTNKTPVDRRTIERCTGIKYIGVLATGYNVVDVQAAADAGITVTNIPSYGTAAVAQFAIALLLELCHHIGEHGRQVKRGDWIGSRDWCFWNTPLIELDGKTMGIVGYGRIGQSTGRIAQALGMKVLAYTPHPNPAAESPTLRYVELEELYERSDVIMLHCPLFPETEGMICRESISKMKDGVILINNSRGPLIVEEDLAEALRRGKVAAAGLDVLREEPMNADCPLRDAPNCLITPHISWASKEARQRIMDTAAANLRAFLRGKAENQVNLR